MAADRTRAVSTKRHRDHADGWTQIAAAIAIIVAEVDSRSMIPVTALLSRALVRTGGLRVIFLTRASFTSLESQLRCGTPGVALSRP